MNQHNVLSDLEELQVKTRETFDAQYVQLRKKSRSFTFISVLHYFIVAFSIAGLGSYISISIIRGTLGYGESLAFILSVAIWVFIAIIPGSLLAGYIRKGKAFVCLLFSLLVNPLLLTSVIYVCATLSQVPNEDRIAANYMTTTIALSVFVFVVLFAFMYVFSQYLSRTFLLTLTSTSAPSTLKAIPSHTGLLQLVLSNTLPVVQKPEWTISRLQRIQAIAQNRIDASNAQGQVLSFIPAVLGLISIIGLLLTQEQIRKVLATVESSLASVFIEQTSTASVNNGFVIIAVILLGGLVLFSMFFFTTTYEALRVLEAIQVVCAVRVAELEDIQVQASHSIAQRSQPLISAPNQHILLKVLSALLMLLYIRHLLRSPER